MANCKICGEYITATGKSVLPALNKHWRDKHPDFAAQNLEKAHERLRQKGQATRDKLALQQEKKAEEAGGSGGGGSSSKSGGGLVTAISPRPAAVVFALGKKQIDIEPDHLFECFYMFEDLKIKHALSQSFSSFLVDACSLTWRLANPQQLPSNSEEKQIILQGAN